MGLDRRLLRPPLAWVFVLWGCSSSTSSHRRLRTLGSDRRELLQIKDSLRFWERKLAWSWSDITRMDVVVERKDLSWDEAEIRVYYTPAGEINIEREDRDFNPELARLIIDKAGLNWTPTRPPPWANCPKAWLWPRTCGGSSPGRSPRCRTGVGANRMQ
ncbi:MAG: hypothetical protein R3A10_18405 [Caldilineaceae bacterium]